MTKFPKGSVCLTILVNDKAQRTVLDNILGGVDAPMSINGVESNSNDWMVTHIELNSGTILAVISPYDKDMPEETM